MVRSDLGVITGIWSVFAIGIALGVTLTFVVYDIGLPLTCTLSGHKITTRVTQTSDPLTFHPRALP